MALHDLGFVDVEEPFTRLRLHGTITKDGAKMSKSRGNVVNPDDYVDRHGADVLRVHLFASGRWSATADLGDEGIAGVERMFGRLWRLVSGEASGPGAGQDALATGAARVAAGIEAMRFNTALGALNELTNRAACSEARSMILLLAPFAPYLAEELWARTGAPYSVHVQSWPEPAAPPATATVVQLVVQVDGRVRDRLTVPTGLGEADVIARAKAAQV